MAKRRRQNAAVDTAEGIGRALGHVAARLDSWKKQRAQIAADLQELMDAGQAMLRDLGHEVEARAEAVSRRVRRKGGRPKGYRMSEATKRKLRLAWKRRKAKAKARAKGAAAE